MIDHANRERPAPTGSMAVKVGGHQASSASMVSIMTALWFGHLTGDDKVAVKPHASPVYHAIKYLTGELDRSYLTTLRQRGGLQAYPSRTKDSDDVDFSTGSVGLGVAMTSFASIVQDYIRAKGWGADWPEGRMIALVGDAELDEGNIYEALIEGWKYGLRNTWWVIDYNRQSLDRVVPERLFQKIEDFFGDSANLLAGSSDFFLVDASLNYRLPKPDVAQAQSTMMWPPYPHLLLVSGMG